MFRNFFEALNRKSLSDQIIEKSVQSIEASKQMYLKARKALRAPGNVALAKEVLEEDKGINKSERSIRRKLLTHFALTDKIDIGSGFAISSIVIDIERIGDYAKNIADLAILTEGHFACGDYESEVKAIEKKLENMFDHTLHAFKTNDEELARAVMTLYKDKISFDCSQLRDNIVLDEKLSTPNATVTALYLRSLKRIAAHLHNICTSIINPFPRIGYKEKKPIE
jgi:phosphate uptake regulator